MSITKALQKRRSRYALNKNLPIPEDVVIALVRDITELAPDAFNMKSARVICVLGDKQDALWDAVFDAFGGKVAREKIDGFKAAAGTVLYYIDQDVVRGLQEQFPLYADNFPIWAEQANGMLQLALWSALAELGVGANLQHYNPVIDEALARLFDVPASWKLAAQRPFGGIAAEPEAKEKEDIERRVRIAR